MKTGIRRTVFYSSTHGHSSCDSAKLLVRNVRGLCKHLLPRARILVNIEKNREFSPLSNYEDLAWRLVNGKTGSQQKMFVTRGRMNQEAVSSCALLSTSESHYFAFNSSITMDSGWLRVSCYRCAWSKRCLGNYIVMLHWANINNN